MVEALQDSESAWAAVLGWEWKHALGDVSDFGIGMMCVGGVVRLIVVVDRRISVSRFDGCGARENLSWNVRMVWFGVRVRRD